MNKTLIDNSANLKMVSVLRDCISMPEMDTIRIATGYWDIPGTALVIDKLQEFLKRQGTKLKLLIGKDPYVYARMLKEPKFMNKSYPDEFIRTNIDDLADNLRDEHKQVINLLLEFCAENNKKIEIRTFKKNEDDESQFLHSKCYIFTSSDDDEKPMHAIVGSSNFTQKGLEGNAELNVLENDPYMINAPFKPTRKGHITWFEEKWNQAEDWTQEFLEQILKPSKPVQEIKKEKEQNEEELSAPLTPYEVYIKLLQKKYGDLIDKDLSKNIENYLPETYMSLEYQMVAVKDCYRRMKEFGGFLLSDVVGLGKTIIGTLLIKHFLEMPCEETRSKKVLIVTPPAIKHSWEETIEDFDKGRTSLISPYVSYVTTGSIGSLIDDEYSSEDDEEIDTGEFSDELVRDDYGLIIIDESHKFRNSDTAMYQALNKLIMEIGDNNVYPYIGLLSATPQNNRPDDLKNQIYLFERNHEDSNLKKACGGNLERFFREIKDEFDFIKKGGNEEVQLTEEQKQKRLQELAKTVRDCILADIMVRRTRTDITKFYKEDIVRQGMIIPRIVGPTELKYKMSDRLSSLFKLTMRRIAPTEEYRKLHPDECLGFYRFTAITEFVDAANTAKYHGGGNRTPQDIAEQLAFIMRILLCKRLESSFTAFYESLKHMKQYTQNMIDMWNNDTIFVCPQIDVNTELDFKIKSKKRNRKVTRRECYDDIRKKIETLNSDGRNEKGQNAEYRRSDFKADYLEKLQNDVDFLDQLCEEWNTMKDLEDPKLDMFRSILNSTLFDDELNKSKRLVIFSESKDTAQKVAAEAQRLGHNVLLVSASNRKKAEPEIRANFDANYKGEKKDDYDIIVTTDVLAEGINLHRANVILNYDTPWNSTKLMQRIGRVNRIGSEHSEVYVYNFMPSDEGDKEIGLYNKSHVKLQSFHTMFGEDAKVYSENEEVQSFGTKHDNFEEEESPEEKYIYELKQYKENHPERYTFINGIESGLEIAVSDAEHSGYFVAKTADKRMHYVKVENNKKGEIISALTLLEAFKVAINSESLVLPSYWDEWKKEAERVVNLKLSGYRREAGKRKAPTAAKLFIEKLLNNNTELSEKCQTLLDHAFDLIDMGNMDVVKKVILFKEKYHGQLDLFNRDNEILEKVLSNELSRIVNNSIKNNGRATVYIGMAK